MVDVATVSNGMPSGQQAAVATPASIDAVFGALLQQITDGSQPTDGLLGVNAAASQAQTGAGQTGSPTAANSNVLALIQNPTAASLGASDLMAAINSAVAVMPITALSSGDAAAVQPNSAAPLLPSSSAKSDVTAGKADAASGDVTQIMPGLMQSAVLSGLLTADTSASASSSAAPPLPVDPTLTTAETASTKPSNQTNGDAQAAAFSAFAAIFAPQLTPSQPTQTQQADAQGTATANAALPSSADTLAANSAGAGSATPPRMSLPNMGQQIGDAGKPSSDSKQETQQSAAPQTTDAAASLPSANVSQPTLTEANANQTGLGPNPNVDAKSDDLSADKVAAAATGSATQDTAASQSAETAAQTAAQTAATTAFAAPLQTPVAQTATAAAAAASDARAISSRTASAKANQAADQATAQATQTQATQAQGTTNKLDAKAKAAQAAKTQTASGKASEADLAAAANSQTTSDPRVDTQAVSVSDAKTVQPDPVRVATTPVNQEKAPADTNAVQQPIAPLVAANASAVTAKLQVTAQHSDSDTVSTLDKLGMTIAARSAEGLHHFDIRLDPAELGRVQVRLTVDDSGQAQATIVADKQQTLDMLQRDSSSLNRALQDAGLNLSNSGLNFSLREQQQQQNEANGQGRRRALAAAAVLSTEASQSRSSQGSYAPNSVRLDIRV